MPFHTAARSAANWRVACLRVALLLIVAVLHPGGTAHAQSDAAPVPATSTVVLEGVRVLTREGATSVLLDLSGPSSFAQEIQADKDRIEIRLTDVERGASVTAIAPGDDPRIEGLRLSTDFVDDSLVLEIRHAPNVEISIQTISNPERIWVLLLDPLPASLEVQQELRIPVPAEVVQISEDIEVGIETVSDDVELTARKILRDPLYNQYIAEGSVQVRYQGITLKADRAVYRANTQEIEGIGNVLLNARDGTLRASRAVISVTSATGILFDASFESDDTGLSFAGVRILKKGDLDYEIEDGTLTSCEQPLPDWSFRGSSLDLTLGEYAHITNARFRVLDVPTLYSPYLILPVKTERQTGFLFPQVGYSDTRGFQVELPFFWAISRNVDATITTRGATEERYGIGLETRYIRTGGSRGEFNFEYFREKQPEDATIENDDGELETVEVNRQRYRIDGFHDERITSSLRGTVLLDVLSDTQLDRDTTDDLDLRTRRFTQSKALLTQSWQRWTLTGAVRWFEDLEDDADDELQDLPSISVRGIRQSIPSTPLVLDLDSTAVNFYRREGADGLRWDTLPRLSLPFQLSRFNVTPSFESRATVYYADVENQVEEQTLLPDGTIETTTRTVLDRSLEARILPRAFLDIDTSISRVFRPGGEDETAIRFKHRIEPFFRYDWIPEIDQDDLPSFDSVDQIDQRSLLRYGLRQTFLARAGSEGRIDQLIQLDLSHSWDLDPQERSDGSDALCPDGPCPVRADLLLTPIQGLGVGGLAGWDFDEEEVTDYTLRLGYQTRRGDSLAVRYRFVRDANLGSRQAGGTRPLEDLRDLSASLRVKAFDWLWLFGSTRYDQENDQFLENRYGFRANPSCCWAVDVWAINRENSNAEDDDEFKVGVLLTLQGLGSAGKSPWYDDR